MSGEGAIVSEYNARGVSLSECNPAAQVGLSLSHADGFHTISGPPASRAPPRVRAQRSASAPATMGHWASLHL
ncbi:TorF family putative porin [Sphingomonas mucosissima]|uniref:TorF family putative porin n=1 Tax=Sphingomonas mucosissima TaxID=370959 RepID=UPI001124F9C8